MRRRLVIIIRLVSSKIDSSGITIFLFKSGMIAISKKFLNCTVVQLFCTNTNKCPGKIQQIRLLGIGIEPRTSFRFISVQLSFSKKRSQSGRNIPQLLIINRIYTVNVSFLDKLACEVYITHCCHGRIFSSGIYIPMIIVFVLKAE